MDTQTHGPAGEVTVGVGLEMLTGAYVVAVAVEVVVVVAAVGQVDLVVEVVRKTGSRWHNPQDCTFAAVIVAVAIAAAKPLSRIGFHDHMDRHGSDRIPRYTVRSLIAVSVLEASLHSLPQKQPPLQLSLKSDLGESASAMAAAAAVVDLRT